MVTLGQGSGTKGTMRLGRFAPARWQAGDVSVHELFFGEKAEGN